MSLSKRKLLVFQQLFTYFKGRYSVVLKLLHKRSIAVTAVDYFDMTVRYTCILFIKLAANITHHDCCLSIIIEKNILLK
jgi:hypothetical protein